MPYSLKLAIGDSTWAWCYAAGIRKNGTILEVNQPFAPHTSLLPDNFIVLHEGKLKWQLSRGWVNAFPVQSKDWMGPFGSPEAVTVHYPAFIPVSVANRGLAACIDFALIGSVLLKVCAREEARKAIAEDMILDEVEPLFRSPSFIPADDSGIDAWKALRPAAWKHAAEDAEKVVSMEAFTPAEAVIRRRIRMEALRRIDEIDAHAVASGALGTDPWFERKTPIGPFRFGASIKPEYPTGAGAPAINKHASNPDGVAAVEGHLISGISGPWKSRINLLEWQHRFATFEADSPIPAFQYRHWTNTNLPPGFVSRGFAQNDWADLTALGLNVGISPPAAAYVAQRQLNLPSARECAEYCLKRAWMVRK